MGVYINGMTMPKSCFECDLYGDENNFCKVQKEYMPFASLGRDYKDANCPMVEVPEPHGRLIDADALMNIFADRLVKVSERYGINSEVAGAVSGAMKLLDVQPTVIEAEGE